MEEKSIDIEPKEQWFPVVIKEETVVRHSEGLAGNNQRDFYHYTTITNEKVILYNGKTGEIKKFNNEKEIIN